MKHLRRILLLPGMATVGMDTEAGDGGVTATFSIRKSKRAAYRFHYRIEVFLRPFCRFYQQNRQLAFCRNWLMGNAINDGVGFCVKLVGRISRPARFGRSGTSPSP